MAKMTSDELLAVFEEMTVLELKEFLDAFEEKFDVTAAAPVGWISKFAITNEIWRIAQWIN